MKRNVFLLFVLKWQRIVCVRNFNKSTFCIYKVYCDSIYNPVNNSKIYYVLVDNVGRSLYFYEKFYGALTNFKSFVQDYLSTCLDNSLYYGY